MKDRRTSENKKNVIYQPKINVMIGQLRSEKLVEKQEYG